MPDEYEKSIIYTTSTTSEINSMVNNLEEQIKDKVSSSELKKSVHYIDCAINAGVANLRVAILESETSAVKRINNTVYKVDEKIDDLNISIAHSSEDTVRSILKKIDENKEREDSRYNLIVFFLRLISVMISIDLILTCILLF